MASKAFDVIVLGATGFTGRQAVLALTHRGATQPLRWAVAGRNLAADALSAFRAATRWDAPAQRLTIDKRIPVAAGMGGGSADAAATLRLAARAAGVDDDALLLRLAAQLGADVPAQVRPGRACLQRSASASSSLSIACLATPRNPAVSGSVSVS